MSMPEVRSFPFSPPRSISVIKKEEEEVSFPRMAHTHFYRSGLRRKNDFFVQCVLFGRISSKFLMHSDKLFSENNIIMAKHMC